MRVVFFRQAALGLLKIGSVVNDIDGDILDGSSCGNFVHGITGDDFAGSRFIVERRGQHVTNGDGFGNAGAVTGQFADASCSDVDHGQART